MKILGIDLAGKQKNPSGICILSNHELFLKTLFFDKDILEEVKRVDPLLIGVDAPLSLPKGRCCLERDCECSMVGHFRQAERDIRPYGRVLPLTFHGMKLLTLRDVKLVKYLNEKYEVIETHPRTDQKILGFTELKLDVSRYFNLRGEITNHTLDSALAALTGYFKVNNCILELGDPVEGIIAIPRDNKCLNLLLD
jgi:hypothetical protein